MEMNISSELECNKMCKRSKDTCLYCKKKYNVSSIFYKAKRYSNNNEVIGYLVKSKDGIIQGILNVFTNFCELAYVDENTIEEFALKMRDATKEERDGVRKYIKSISTKSNINFFDLLEKQNDCKRPNNK